MIFRACDVYLGGRKLPLSRSRTAARLGRSLALPRQAGEIAREVFLSGLRPVNPGRNANLAKTAQLSARYGEPGGAAKSALFVSSEEWRKRMKAKSKISAYKIRSGAWAVFLSVTFIALRSAAATGGSDTMAKTCEPTPERSPSPSASLISERSKRFTGVIGSGRKRIRIPSLRSMR